MEKPYRQPSLVWLCAAVAVWGTCAGVPRTWADGDPAAHELRMWVVGKDRGLEAALGAFERDHPGWRVVLSQYSGGRDAQKLMTAIAGGDPPDIIMQDRFTIGEWAARGAFHRLNDLLSEAERAEREGGPDAIRAEEFYPACWMETVYAGGVYGVPYSTDTRALYYNEDVLIGGGFVDDQGRAQPPRTWAELERYTVALTTHDASGRITRLGFAPNYGDSWLYIYGWLNGGRFMSDDGRTVTMNQPPIVEALAFMKRLYESVGGVERTDAFLGATAGVQFDPLATGRLGMKIDGNWQLQNLTEFHPHARYRVAPPPAPQGMPTLSWAGGYSYVIPATAKHPAAAFELIRFLVSDRGWALRHGVNARYAASKGRGYLPTMTAQPAVNREVLERYVRPDPNVPARAAEALETFYGLMEVAKFRPVTPVGQLLWDEHVRAIELATRGGADPRATLDAAAGKVQAALDEVLREGGVGRPVSWGAVSAATAGAAGLGVGLTLLVAWRRGVFRRYRSDETLAALFFAGPWVIGFLALTAGPVVMSLVYSFCRYSVLRPAEWVGLENFRRLFFEDPMFWYSLANTAYMLMGVPLGMAVGLGIAMLLNTEVRGMKLYRTVYYLPAIVPVVASAILWVWVLNPENGLVNALLMMVGVADPPRWLNSPSWGLGSKAAILLMGLWGAGAGMIIWLAGLKGIPSHLYEAATIDGAGPVQRFRHVTLPMLTPYIFFNLIMGVIGTMQIFTQAFIMTQGGPADSTMYYAYYLFNQAFRYFNMGYASALAWVLLLIILGLTLLQMWSSRRWVYYESA